MQPLGADATGARGSTRGDQGARRGVVDAFLAGAGLIGFAATVHGGTGLRLVALLGLLLAALCLARALGAGELRTSLVGVSGWGAPHGAFWSAAGLALGGALALWYRAYLGGPLMPLGLRPFAAMATLIGAAEELVYRGYVQGRLRPLGPVGATLWAAGLHALYKGALFCGPPLPAPVADVGVLAGFTFAGGALLGALRERAGTVWPCLVAHVVFDLLVYGDSATAPWWVWG